MRVFFLEYLKYLDRGNEGFLEFSCGRLKLRCRQNLTNEILCWYIGMLEVVSRISNINKKKNEGRRECTFDELCIPEQAWNKTPEWGLAPTCPLRSFYPWKTCEKQVTMWVYFVLLLIQEAIFLWYWISFLLSCSILISKLKGFYCNKPNYVRLVMLVEIKPENL